MRELPLKLKAIVGILKASLVEVIFWKLLVYY